MAKNIKNAITQTSQASWWESISNGVIKYKDEILTGLVVGVTFVNAYTKKVFGGSSELTVYGEQTLKLPSHIGWSDEFDFSPIMNEIQGYTFFEDKGIESLLPGLISISMHNERLGIALLIAETIKRIDAGVPIVPSPIEPVYLENNQTVSEVVFKGNELLVDPDGKGITLCLPEFWGDGPDWLNFKHKISSSLTNSTIESRSIYRKNNTVYSGEIIDDGSISSNRLKAYDVTDVDNQILLADVELLASPNRITSHNNTLIVAVGNEGIEFRDLLGTPILNRLGNDNTIGYAKSIAMIPNTNYLTVGTSNKFIILQIDSLGATQYISDFLLPNEVEAIVIKNNIAYLAVGNSGVYLLDVSDVLNIQELSNLSGPSQSFAKDLEVSEDGNTIYVANNVKGVQRIDATDKNNLASVYTEENIGEAGALCLQNKLLLVNGEGSGSTLYNLSNNAGMIPLVTLPEVNNSFECLLHENKFHIPDGRNGWKIIDFSQVIFEGDIPAGDESKYDFRIYVYDGDSEFIIIFFNSFTVSDLVATTTRVPWSYNTRFIFSSSSSSIYSSTTPALTTSNGSLVVDNNTSTTISFTSSSLQEVSSEKNPKNTTDSSGVKTSSSKYISATASVRQRIEEIKSGISNISPNEPVVITNDDLYVPSDDAALLYYFVPDDIQGVYFINQNSELVTSFTQEDINNGWISILIEGENELCFTGSNNQISLEVDDKNDDKDKYHLFFEVDSEYVDCDELNTASNVNQSNYLLGFGFFAAITRGRVESKNVQEEMETKQVKIQV